MSPTKGTGKVTPPPQSDPKTDPKALKKRRVMLSTGTIMRVIPGTYMMTAKTSNGEIPEVRCLYVPGMMSSLFGVKDCSMPTEGTPVLLLATSNSRTRIALCCLPEEMKGFKNLDKVDWASMYGSSPEPGVNYFTEDSYVTEGTDKNKKAHVLANSNRPWSMLPGEWAQGNTMGVFLAVFHFMATLKATERAKLECFVLDDLVRITSGQYQHWNAFGETHIFDDGGMNSIEISGSHTSPEVRGYGDFAEAVKTTDSSTANEERFKPTEERVVMKRRFRMFMGGLGDMVQIYLRNVQQDLNPAKNDPSDPFYSELTERGMGASFKLHLANSGALDIVSSVGIGASLNDKILIPQRIKEPWDPSGDKPELSTKENNIFKKKEHFNYDPSGLHPYMRNIETLEGEAWETALSYQRFDELKKDFSMPEPSTLDGAPYSFYDALESNSRQSDYSNRKAGWKIEQDGSVRLWDNWGAEIYMRGGDIVFACPGNIIMQPGKAIIGMSNDIVMKAKTSVDINATEKDVRITAGQNIAAYAESGMLFEANGSREPTYPEDVKGEDVPGGGIVFKARNSSIYFWTKRFTLYVDYFITKALEEIVMSAKYLSGVLTGRFMLEAGGSAGIGASTGSTTVFGPSVNVLGSGSVNVVKGNKVLVPLTWAPGDQNPYESYISTVISIHNAYVDEGIWLSVLQSDLRDNLKFTYRTPEQYGTTRGIETYQPESQVTVYQTRWQFLKKNGYKFIDGSTDTWSEVELNGTFPWPGLAVRDTAYLSCPSVNNVDPVTLTSKDRKDLKGTFDTALAKGSMDEYIIMK